MVDLSDSDDDTTEVEILGDTTGLVTNLFEDLVEKYGESYMDEVMEVECDEENSKSVDLLKKTDPCREWSEEEIVLYTFTLQEFFYYPQLAAYLCQPVLDDDCQCDPILSSWGSKFLPECIG